MILYAQEKYLYFAWYDECLCIGALCLYEKCLIGEREETKWNECLRQFSAYLYIQI